ncbi:type II secretion system protein N [Sphingomicrobium nitratireducens]|uniref:type II secretion system protein N n=1 Tax=Sphingomicrobium nitratireducens TaxID=2964666 RepID=UPI00223F2010|nr:type II secretion system protein N [Sphingomicrobium nitratireducens]
MARIIPIGDWWRDRLAVAQAHLVLRALMLGAAALLAARLVWVLLTPLGPLNGWQAPVPVAPPAEARAILFERFNPFPQASAGGGDVTTGLDLTLYGVRENRGAGTGGAIIGLPDGTQASFGVGEEILPGAILSGVAFDHVVIDRGGISERLYMEGASDAPVVSPAPGPAAGPASGPAARLVAENVFRPRLRGDAVTGVIVSPTADASLLAQVGLKPGDVIVGVNGAAIQSAKDVEQLAAALRPGISLNLSVERGAGVIPVALKL